MPWIPFEKFILPSCQLSLICAKAVRRHYWFRRLAHTIHGIGIILLISNKSSIRKSAIRQLLLGSWWKDPWARQTGEHWTDGPYFSGATDFWHCARTMPKSNMRENLQPTSEAPVKSKTHTPTWLQVEKEQCNHNFAHAEWRARENIAANRLYDIFSDTGFKHCNCTCRSLECGTWCVLLNDKICPPPWEHTHLGESTIPNNWCEVSPGAWQQAVLHVGRGRSGVSHTAGMWGLWSLLGAGRWEVEIWFGTCQLERHAERQTSVLGSAGLGQSTQHLGDVSKGFLTILIFLWSMELMAGFPQQLFLECFWFPWKSASAPASAAWQATTSPPQEGAQGLLKAAASLHSKTNPGSSLSSGWK